MNPGVQKASREWISQIEGTKSSENVFSQLLRATQAHERGRKPAPNHGAAKHRAFVYLYDDLMS